MNINPSTPVAYCTPLAKNKYEKKKRPVSFPPFSSEVVAIL